MKTRRTRHAQVSATHAIRSWIQSGEYFVTQGQQHALKLFHRVGRSVPAYKDFLRKNHIDPLHIKTYKDFTAITPVTKENYLNRYSLKELVWNGDLSRNMMITASSGTTGLPYFWPLTNKHIDEGAVLHELIYRQSFAIDKHKTLMIICFGMGTWIAGMYTFLTSLAVHEKGYPLTLITPGFNKEETLRILLLLSPQFEQTIIAGIPTFVKDVLEEWKDNKAHHTVPVIKLLFAGEGFSEAWRSYVLDLVHSKNVLTDSVSILGSADAAMMGFETPQSIAIRRRATQNNSLRHALFHDERVPALSAYVPTLRFFETGGDELLLTANRSIPLIRYNIHDQGGTLSPSHTLSVLKDHDIDLARELRIHHTFTPQLNFPYVYVFGRGKFIATIYAANIYPENIRDTLVHPSVRTFVTGRFTQETKYKENQDHYLNINVELAPHIGRDAQISRKIVSAFVETVQKTNSEFRRIYQEYGIKARPKVMLHQYGEPRLFPENKLKKSS